MKNILSAVLLSLLCFGNGVCEEIRPAVIFDIGGKFDKSFNESVYNGMKKFTSDTGIEFVEFEVVNETQREQATRRFAQRGYSPVIVVGFAQQRSLEKVAKDYPDIKFAIIDAVVDLPNVASIVFREHEGSFLVGMLAALASKTKKVGFVGGMDVPLIRKFACGYKQGVRHVLSDAKIYENMTGNTPAAWNDPIKGKELAIAQFGLGADVIFAAAGGTGLGVLLAASENGRLAIGVDSNQNYLHPGSILTSMLKRVDVAAWRVCKMAMDGAWKSGVVDMGLSDEGVGYALDEHNRSLITEAMISQVEKAKEQIISGEILVHDYTINNSCNY